MKIEHDTKMLRVSIASEKANGRRQPFSTCCQHQEDDAARPPTPWEAQQLFSAGNLKAEIDKITIKW